MNGVLLGGLLGSHVRGECTDGHGGSGGDDLAAPLARKKHGSKSRAKQKALVAKAHQHVQNQRLDFARKLAVTLFKAYDLVSYEDLNIRGMLGGYLSKSVLDAAWGVLVHALVCKAEEAGKWAVAVDPRGTTQRCSRCSDTPKVKLTLRDRVHYCTCSPPMGRDHNAARNIDALGLSVLDAA